MITIRRSEERGHENYRWLDTRHTFSFGNYYDPNHMGFGPLRVINDDRVAPGGGFPTHPHNNMEIISYVIDGAIEHKDSMGTGSIVRAGEFQRMTAGTGVAHSEFNPSDTDPLHFLQIWILPERRGLKPEYEQRGFSDEERRGRLRLVASRGGVDGSLHINQDARLYSSLLSDGDEVKHSFDSGRRGWLHVVKGTVTLNCQKLSGGDGAAITDVDSIQIQGVDDGEVLLFDLP